MVGILTEKPSAGRNFGKALGGMQGTYNGEQYLIVSARGHLFEFDQPENLVAPDLAARYKSWDLANLPWDETKFSWRRVKRGDVGPVLSAIKSGLSQCDEIVIATDVDPTGEGELLAWEILDELKFRPRKWSRMYFTDEAPASIQKAFASRRQIPSMAQDMDFVKADYRSKFDFLTMQFTRIASKNGDGRTVLRQGRLKSAMVLIVGDQLAKVAAYKKVPYYQNRFRDDHGVVYTDPDEPTYPDKSQVPAGLHASPVVRDGAQMKRQGPPKLLDLASLSARLSSKGYKAKQVLDTYQKMYEAQVVSYPRTEDKVITPEQFNELLPLVDRIAAVVGVDPAVLTHRTPRPTHVKTGGAHGANRPGPNVPAVLASLDQYDAAGAKGLAKEIYVLLARNYLATLAEDYEYEAQVGHVRDYPTYKGGTSVPKVAGWKAVFDDAEPDGDSTAGGLGSMAEPFVHEGFPPKPAQPTMKWLMKELEKHDVGTGATRTTIYADVTSDKQPDKQLLQEAKGKLSMAKAGEMSYRLLPGTHIGDLKLTEQLQADMRDIAAGKADPAERLSRVRQMVLDDIAAMAANAPSMRSALGVQAAANYAEGTWNGRAVRFKASWAGHDFTQAEIADLLAGKEIKVMGAQGKSGTFNAKGRLEEQAYNGRTFVGFKSTGFLNDDGTDRQPSQASPGDYCEGTWRKKKIRFKRSWGGHRFTDQECQTLLAGGEVSFPAKSKAGNDYTAVGKLEEQTFNGRKFVGFKADFGKR